jgi:hypothetical protein
VKRTPLQRKTPLRQKKPMNRSGRIAPRSRKTIAELPERDRVRQEVLQRDRECRGRGLTPVDCTGASTDVHELKRGANRRECYLDAERCIGLCRTCHTFVTLNPAQAHELGLARWTWEPW